MRICSYDEYSIGPGMCAPRLKLGQPCREARPDACPINAYCNGQGVCACRCGNVPITDTICGPRVTKCIGTNTTISDPPPYCTGFRGYSPSLGPTGLPPPVPGALDQCPDGQVCMDLMYMPTSTFIGICCPVPGKMPQDTPWLSVNQPKLSRKQMSKQLSTPRTLR